MPIYSIAANFLLSSSVSFVNNESHTTSMVNVRAFMDILSVTNRSKGKDGPVVYNEGH